MPEVPWNRFVKLRNEPWSFPANNVAIRRRDIKLGERGLNQQILSLYDTRQWEGLGRRAATGQERKPMEFFLQGEGGQKGRVQCGLISLLAILKMDGATLPGCDLEMTMDRK